MGAFGATTHSESTAMLNRHLITNSDADCFSTGSCATQTAFTSDATFAAKYVSFTLANLDTIVAEKTSCLTTYTLSGETAMDGTELTFNDDSFAMM